MRFLTFIAVFIVAAPIVVNGCGNRKTEVEPVSELRAQKCTSDSQCNQELGEKCLRSRLGGGQSKGICRVEETTPDIQIEEAL